MKFTQYTLTQALNTYLHFFPQFLLSFYVVFLTLPVFFVCLFVFIVFLLFSLFFFFLVSGLDFKSDESRTMLMVLQIPRRIYILFFTYVLDFSVVVILIFHSNVMPLFCWITLEKTLVSNVLA